MKNKKSAFSIVLAIILVIGAAVAIAGITPILTRKLPNLSTSTTIKNPKGWYEAYNAPSGGDPSQNPGKDPDSLVPYDRYCKSNGKCTDPQPCPATGCVFNPPTGITKYEVFAIGGGGGGGSAVDKNPSSNPVPNYKNLVVGKDQSHTPTGGDSASSSINASFVDLAKVEMDKTLEALNWAPTINNTQILTNPAAPAAAGQTISAETYSASDVFYAGTGTNIVSDTYNWKTYPTQHKNANLAKYFEKVKELYSDAYGVSLPSGNYYYYYTKEIGASFYMQPSKLLLMPEWLNVKTGTKRYPCPSGFNSALCASDSTQISGTSILGKYPAVYAYGCSGGGTGARAICRKIEANLGEDKIARWCPDWKTQKECGKASYGTVCGCKTRGTCYRSNGGSYSCCKEYYSSCCTTKRDLHPDLKCDGEVNTEKDGKCDGKPVTAATYAHDYSRAGGVLKKDGGTAAAGQCDYIGVTILCSGTDGNYACTQSNIKGGEISVSRTSTSTSPNNSVISSCYPDNTCSRVIARTSCALKPASERPASCATHNTAVCHEKCCEMESPQYTSYCACGGRSGDECTLRIAACTGNISGGGGGKGACISDPNGKCDSCGTGSGPDAAASSSFGTEGACSESGPGAAPGKPGVWGGPGVYNWRYVWYMPLVFKHLMFGTAGELGEQIHTTITLGANEKLKITPGKGASITDQTSGKNGANGKDTTIENNDVNSAKKINLVAHGGKGGTGSQKTDYYLLCHIKDKTTANKDLPCYYSASPSTLPANGYKHTLGIQATSKKENTFASSVTMSESLKNGDPGGGAIGYGTKSLNDFVCDKRFVDKWDKVQGTDKKASGHVIEQQGSGCSGNRKINYLTDDDYKKYFSNNADAKPKGIPDSKLDNFLSNYKSPGTGAVVIVW